MAGKTDTLYGIQKLRAIAAYGVVIFHLFEFLNAASSLGFPRFTLGRTGVDLFFVISGFIMVYTTRDAETPREFMAKRVSRIVPLYWAATLVTVALVAVAPSVFPAADISWQKILASLAFIPAADHSGEAMPVLLVGWSLNMEMLFYAIFAGALFLPARIRLPALLTGIVGLVLACRLFADGSLAGDFYGRIIMLDFAAGCVLAYLLRLPALAAFMRRTPMWPLMLVAAAGFVAAEHFLASGKADIYDAAIGASATLLVFAVAGADLYRGTQRGRFLVPLGDASYSAYLLHPILLRPAAMVLATAFGDTWLTAILLFIVALPGTMLVSWLSYRLFERPTNRLLRGWFTPPHAAST